MSTDALFLIVGTIAIAAAIAMLTNKNAVYSALFLIVNFACVAFLYLMLDAPFLAMIQIAVYAGAIMVLFLFVIMLLGAEDGDKLHSPARQFNWLAPLGIALALIFGAVTTYAILNGKIDLGGASSQAPMLRVVHAAPYAGPVDVYANGQLFAENVAFGEATDFKNVPAGDYVVALNPAGTDTPVLSVTISLADDDQRSLNTYSAVAHGGTATTAPTVSLVEDNLETVPARTARVTIFNGFDQSLNLVDYGSDFDATDDRVVVSNIQPGGFVELPPVNETTSLRSWRLTNVDEAQTDLSKLDTLFSLGNADVFSLKRDTSQLLIVSNQQSENSVRPVVIPVVDKSLASFGSPQSIGQLLFTRFMLPFQLIAVLLLAAMIGAIVLTHKEGSVTRQRDLRRRVIKPLSTVITGQVGSDVLAAAEAQPQLPEQQASGD